MVRTYLGDIPNPHVRDFQRKRLYDAEVTCAFWDNINILTLDEIDSFITDIAIWANIKKPDILVQGHEDIPTAYATPTEIVLPFPLAQSIPFICHEMSHVINYQRGPADHHGANFAKVYLEVVSTFIGKESYDELKTAFDHLRVRYENVI